MLQSRLILGVFLLAMGCSGRSPTVPSQAPVSDPRAAFADAYSRFHRGDLEGALPVFTALTTSYPALGDYHLYFIGLISTRRGRDDEATAAFTRLLQDYPQSVHAATAELELGLALERGGQVEEARLHLQQASAARDTATVQRARLALAELDLHSGDVAAAAAGFTQVRRAAPGSATARAAKQQLLALRTDHPELAPTGSQRLDEQHLLLAERDYAAAESAADDILKHPEGVDPADALQARAEAQSGAGKTEAALATLQEIADHYPSSPAAPAACFRRATMLWNRDDDAAALIGFQTCCRRYPGAARVAEGLYAIGRIQQKEGHTSQAEDTFVELVQRYPESSVAGEAHWRIGWIHYLARDWSGAATAFAQLAQHTRTPQREEALYWQARALEHAGNAASARALYREIIDAAPNGYYAMWADQRLGSAPAARTPPRGVRQPESVTLSRAPLAETFHSERYNELRLAGVDTLARGELSAIEATGSTDTATLQFLLRAYQAVNGYAAAVRLARRLDDTAGLSPSEREGALYPLAFWATVRHEADAQAIDPLLVVAIMRQESLFDPEARSSADARGLMQLLPATAERVAAGDQLAVDRGELMRPEVNIQLGTRHLRSLLDRFQGDTLKAVAAYNGGEGAVEKWDQQFAGLEADEFVESISYRETRDYVKRVLANYRTYQLLYTGRVQPAQ